MHLRHRNIWLIAALSIAVTSCFNGPTFLRQKNTAAIEKVAETATSTAEKTAAETTAAGVLAIGTEMITELKDQLLTAGLSVVQSEAIADQAQGELQAGVVIIQTASGLRLTEADAGAPIVLAAPYVLRGAAKALDDAKVKLGTVAARAAILEVIVGSSFRSFNGRTDALDDTAIQKLSGNLVAEAVNSLSEAGLGNDGAIEASRAITAGSIGAVNAAGINSDAVNGVISSIVTSTANEFATIKLSESTAAAVLTSATKGAVAGVGTAKLTSDAGLAAVAIIAEKAVAAVKSFSSESNSVQKLTAAATEGAVAALKDSGLQSNISNAVMTISKSAVTGLTSAGFADDTVIQAVGSVASGAIKGLGAGASTEQISSGGLAAAAIDGALTSYATTSATDTAKTAVIAAVVKQSVTSLTSVTSATTKSNLLSEVVSAAVGGIATVGVTNSATTATILQSVTTNATQALSSAGFASTAIKTATQKVTEAAVKGIDTIVAANVSSATIQNLVTVAVNGVSSGLTALHSSGQIDASVKESTLQASATTATATVSTINVVTALPDADKEAITTGVTTSITASTGTTILAVIRYPQAAVSLGIGISMQINPIVDTVAPTSCNITPTLPPGLSLSTTCSIIGAPTSNFASAVFTITPATNNGAGPSTSLSLAVLPPSGAPVVTGAQVTANPRPTWTWGRGTGGSGNFRIKLNNADLSSSPTTTTTTFTPASALSEGAHTLYVQETNAAGSWSPTGSATITVDLTPPAMPQFAAFSTPTNNRNPTISWVSQGGGNGSYRYRLDNGDLSVGATVTSSTSFTASNLADGMHTFYVQERDQAGNWSSVAILNFEINTAAPTAIVTGAPAGPSNALTIALSVSGSNVTQFKYKLGPTVTTSCSTSSGYSTSTPAVNGIDQTLTAFDDGSLTLCVVGGDSIGNWQTFGSVVPKSWIKDTTPPGLPTANSTTTPTNNRPTWSLTSNSPSPGNGTFKVSIDDPGFNNFTMVTTGTFTAPTALGDGNHLLYFKERDDAGNWSPIAQSPAYIDTTPPQTIITSFPTGISNATSISVIVGGADVAQYKFKLGASVTTDCIQTTGYGTTANASVPISVSITNVPDGPVMLCVLGVDAAGNWQPYGSAANATWHKDTTPPGMPVISGVTPTNNTLPTWTWTQHNTEPGNSTFRLKLDEPDLTTDSTLVNAYYYSPASPLSDGNHTLFLQEKDNAGNWSQTASYTIRVDTIAPTAVISGAPSGSSNNMSLNVTVSGADVSSYMYKLGPANSLDCGTSAGYSPPYPVTNAIIQSFSAQPDGQIKLCVAGGDIAGNWQNLATVAPAIWTKDTVAPPPLVSANANRGPTPGDIALHLDLPTQVSDITWVKVRRAIGSQAPTDCSSGTLVVALNGPFAPTATLSQIDATGSPDAMFSYRVCIFDAASNLTTQTIVGKMSRKSWFDHRVFVTNSVYQGDFKMSGPWGSPVSAQDGADKRCSYAASLAGLTGAGSWFAVMSDGTNTPDARLNLDGTYSNMAGTQIAPSKIEFLAGSSSSLQTESNAAASGNIWTGLVANGAAAFNRCSGFTTLHTTSQGSFGTLGTNYISSGNQSCSTAARLLCVSQETPLPLVKFASNPGLAASSGAIGLEVGFPNSSIDYGRLEIRSLMGSISPNKTCNGSDGSTVIHTSTTNFTTPLALSVPGFTIGRFYSFRACVYDTEGLLKHSMALSGVLPKGGNVAFVTSTAVQGGLKGSFPSGVDAANEYCKSAAYKAGLENVIWRAALGSLSPPLPNTNINSTYPLFNMAGTMVAPSGLWSTHAAAMSYNEYGTALATPTHFWSNLTESGNYYSDSCSSWQFGTAGYMGRIGNAAGISAGNATPWADTGTAVTCDSSFPLLCVTN